MLDSVTCQTERKVQERQSRRPRGKKIVRDFPVNCTRSSDSEPTLFEGKMTSTTMGPLTVARCGHLVVSRHTFLADVGFHSHRPVARGDAKARADSKHRRRRSCGQTSHRS